MKGRVVLRQLTLLLYVIPGYAAAQWWNDDVTTNGLMIASNVAIIADWAQTREIADNSHYYEKNSYLGAYPTTGEVNRFFVGTLLIHNIIGALLPDRQRKLYYGGQLGFRLNVVKNNADIGIEFKF